MQIAPGKALLDLPESNLQGMQLMQIAPGKLHKQKTQSER